MADWSREELSPDGLTRVRWRINPQRMSHETWTPSIEDAASGVPILTLADEGFDGRPSWTEAGGFRLDLRHYWRAGTLSITVDRAAGLFRFGDGRPEPLAELSRRVEAEFVRMDDEARRNPPPRPAIGPSQSTLLLRWILIFGGVAAFFAIIVGIAFAQGY